MVEFTQLFFAEKKVANFGSYLLWTDICKFFYVALLPLSKKVDWVKPEGMGPPEALHIYYN